MKPTIEDIPAISDKADAYIFFTEILNPIIAFIVMTPCFYLAFKEVKIRKKPPIDR